MGSPPRKLVFPKHTVGLMRAAEERRSGSQAQTQRAEVSLVLNVVLHLADLS